MAFTFYRDWDQVIAIDLELGEGYMSVYGYVDSPVAWGAAPTWLEDCTAPISEADARCLHPRLFARLDADMAGATVHTP